MMTGLGSKQKEQNKKDLQDLHEHCSPHLLQHHSARVQKCMQSISHDDFYTPDACHPFKEYCTLQKSVG